MAARPPGSPSSRDAAPPALTPAAILTTWAGGRLPRAVLVAGPETALREEALANIRRAAFGAGDGGLSWVVLRGPLSEQEPQTLEAAAILDEVRTRPLFGAEGELKVVVVRHADLFLGAGKGADARDIFERSLEGLPADGVLVFEVAQDGALRNTRFYKGLAARGGVVDCGSVRNAYELDGADSRLADEMIRRGAALGLELDAGAAVALIERSGQDLGVLEEELAKLALSLAAAEGRRVPVREADVVRLCASSRLVSPFEFADAVAVREARPALEALHAVFAHGLGDYRKPGRVVTSEGDIAMRLLAALTWKLTQLQDLRAALDAGRREYEAFQAAKLFGPARQDAARQGLRRHTAASLRAALEALLEANLALRTNQGRQEVMEKLVWTICRGVKQDSFRGGH